MLTRRYYNRTDDARQNRSKTWTVLGLVLLFHLSACEGTKVTGVDRVCEERIGSKVTIEGVITLPRVVNTVYVTRGGAFAANGYQAVLSDKASESANVTIWSAEVPQPNRIRALSEGADKSTLRIYSDRGDEINLGQTTRITGEVVSDPTGCAVNAELIEIAQTN